MARACFYLWLVMSVGCRSFIDDRAADTTYRVLLSSQVAARRQADVELAEQAMPGGLIQLQAFALSYPDHRGFQDLYAEATCQYAVGFLFDDWEDASLGGRAEVAAHLQERLGPLLAGCVDANLARLPAAWRAAWARGADAVVALLPSARRADLPAVLWLGSAEVVALALDPLAHLARLGSIQAILERCAALDPGYHDADALVLLATLAAARSQLLGGDDGGAGFDRARALAGDGALMIDVMFARAVAVARKDRALFEATLRRVLAAELARWPERRLDNALAVRKARRYLAAEAALLP